jgi:hypothetical protein
MPRDRPDGPHGRIEIDVLSNTPSSAVSISSPLIDAMSAGRALRRRGMLSQRRRSL